MATDCESAGASRTIVAGASGDEGQRKTSGLRHSQAAARYTKNAQTLRGSSRTSRRHDSMERLEDYQSTTTAALTWWEFEAMVSSAGQNLVRSWKPLLETPSVVPSNPGVHLPLDNRYVRPSEMSNP